MALKTALPLKEECNKLSHRAILSELVGQPALSSFKYREVQAVRTLIIPQPMFMYEFCQRSTTAVIHVCMCMCRYVGRRCKSLAKFGICKPEYWLEGGRLGFMPGRWGLLDSIYLF